MLVYYVHNLKTVHSVSASTSCRDAHSVDCLVVGKARLPVANNCCDKMVAEYLIVPKLVVFVTSFLPLESSNEFGLQGMLAT